MHESLTEKQQFLYEFIENYQMEYGKSPTIKEMREYCNVSSDNSILKHLKALEEKGYIQKDDTPRGIKLLASIKEKLTETSNQFKLPLMGFVPAGTPTLNEEYVDDWMSVGNDFISDPKNCFLLRVTGNSMIDAGIFEGDLVVVDRKKEPKNGDIVVALVDGGNTVKTLVKQAGKTYLKAENKDYTDIIPEEDLVVQGVVLHLIRSY